MFVSERITPHFVTIDTAGTEISLGYQRPRSKIWDPDNRWHKSTENIIIGDLNAIHNTWSAGKGNTQGKILREWLNERPKLEVINRYEITRVTTNPNHSSSTIDLVMANPESRVQVRHRVIAATEHRALEIKTNLKWTQTTEKPLRYDKADWKKIETELALLNENDDDPTCLQKYLTDIILRHTPRATGKAKAFWNKELAQMRKEIIKLIPKRTGGNELVKARRNFRKAIAQAKLKANETALQEETDPECFRTVKLKATKHTIPALLRKDNTMAAEHNHIATELQDSLYDGEHCRTEPETIQATDPEIDAGDIQKALMASPNGASTGPDMIPTRLLRLLWKTK